MPFQATQCMHLQIQQVKINAIINKKSEQTVLALNSASALACGTAVVLKSLFLKHESNAFDQHCKFIFIEAIINATL